MFLWHELWTPDVSGAARFYAQLSDLAINRADSSTADGETIEYRVLRDRERPRAGVRSLPDAAMPSAWMPYVRIENRASLDEILQQVARLGGEVLVPAVARPAGGHVAVIADPSGAPLALQTWADEQPLLGRL
jgi:predicted enzyme related to lactoylglutathione lyase